MKRIYPFLFGLISLLGACTPKPLRIDVPQPEPEVIVFSQIIPPTVMAVGITQSFSALSFSEENGDTVSNSLLNDLFVGGADVTVSYANRTDTLFGLDSVPGLYLNPFIPQLPGEPYTLNIRTRDGKELSATSLMLRRIPFDTIHPVLERGELVKFKYAFEDPTEANWYMINFYSNSVSPPDSLDPDSLDLDALLINPGNVLLSTQLISDQLIENGYFEGEVELPQLTPEDTVFAALSHISEEYYQFVSLRRSASNFFTELTREPVNYPTNVTGGKGFFLTHFPDVRAFDLNEW